MFNIWFDYDMIVCFIHPFWYSCLNTKTYSCFPFCSRCCYLLALVLTFLFLSLFSGGFWQALPDLHGGLLHLSGITYGGDSHPRILSVRKTRLLAFTERIDEALHNEESKKAILRAFRSVWGLCRNDIVWTKMAHQTRRLCIKYSGIVFVLDILNCFFIFLFDS